MAVFEYGDGGASYPTVPGFEIVRRLGSGGFSVVYEAVQQDVQAAVVLKVLQLDISDAKQKSKFERECLTMGRLRDRRGIVAVYRAAFTTDGRPVIVMAYMPGGSLAQRLVEVGPLAPGEVVTIGREVADALAEAHASGIFHQDVKPENLLIGRDGHVALGDFGIAMVQDLAIASQNESALTPSHAPPERLLINAEGGDDLAAGDIYSLGSTLYQLLTGRPPFGTVNEGGIGALAIRIAGQPPPPITRADVPEHLRDAIETALSKRPTDRFRSAEEFALALQGPTLAHVPEAEPVSVVQEAETVIPSAWEVEVPSAPAKEEAADPIPGGVRPLDLIDFEYRGEATRIVQGDVDEPQAPVDEPRPEQQKQRPPRAVWLVVAAALALFTIGIVLFFTRSDDPGAQESPTVVSRAESLNVNPASVTRVAAAPNGRSLEFDWTDPNGDKARDGSYAVGYQIIENDVPGKVQTMPVNNDGDYQHTVTAPLGGSRDQAARRCVRVVFISGDASEHVLSPQTSASCVR